MTAYPRARVAGLLALLALLGLGAAESTRPGTHIGAMWPVGLASGVLLVVAPRLRPAVALAVLCLGAGTFLLGGYPVAVAVGYAASIVLLAVATTVVLSHRALSTGAVADLDLVGYLVASTVGAAAGAGGFALTSALTGFGHPAMVALASGVAHLASQLTLLAFFVDHERTSGTDDLRGTALRWAVSLVVTVLAFLPTPVPTLVFLVLPLLAWTALRASVREALWMLVAISSIVNTLTFLGLGPFATLLVVEGQPAELVPLPHYAFIVGCALVCIPFAMAVRRQRASALEAAHERERYQRILRASTGLSIVETDDIGRIVLVNPGAESLLGYAADELVGRTPELFHTQAEVERQAAQLGCPADLMHVSLAVARPGTGARDWVFVRKDGRERTVSMEIVPITDDSGAVTGYLSTAEDITERVRTQEALVTALETERRAVARLTEVDRTKDAFVSSVSHELRTPITNIVGYLELLLDGAYGETTAPQHEALGRIDLNSHRLLELIDDLLTLSSIESLDVELTREPVDLRDVVRRSADLVHPSSRRRDQRLDLQLPEQPVVVLGDRDHLERMVGNLAGNAVKFTPEGGTVTLRVVGGAGSCAIEVSDTGVGIPDEEQPQLFNRFFRTAHAQHEAIQGSGLGLPIARSIAELHGARISASSTPGEGSVFTVAFPVHGLRRHGEGRGRAAGA